MIFQNETKRLMVLLKKTGAAILASSLVLGAGSVYADEISETETPAYEIIKIDEMTGQPITEDESDYYNTDGEQEITIQIDANCTYNRSTSEYSFSISEIGDNIISSNVCSGILTKDPVKVSISNNVESKIYRDGIEIQNDGSFSQTGSYVIKIYGANGRNFTPLKFTIIGDYTNSYSASVSGIYEIDYALIGDNTITSENGAISLNEEGQYSIYVKNTKLGTSEKLVTTVLHNAPTLKLEALDENNLARGPVDISDAKSEWDMTVYFNGTLINQTGQLVDSGNYAVTVTDKAGNSNTYTFTILLYIDNYGIIFISVISGLAFLFLIYLVISRKRMKVR